MAEAILTKDVTLSYATTADAYTKLNNLQEVPEIGNNAPERLDVTTLDDAVKKYINGLGDSAQELAFKFVYTKDDEQFTTLSGMTGTSVKWKVTLPNEGVTATFDGIPMVKTDSISVNNYITYTLTIIVETEITFA